MKMDNVDNDNSTLPYNKPKHFIVIDDFTFDTNTECTFGITFKIKPNRDLTKYVSDIDVSWQKLVSNSDYWLSADDLDKLNIYQVNKNVIPVTKNLKTDLKKWSQKMSLAKINNDFSESDNND